MSQDHRHLAQLPPPDPRFDARMQGERGLGGVDQSHLRGGSGGGGDGSFFPGRQQGIGTQVYSLSGCISGCLAVVVSCVSVFVCGCVLCVRSVGLAVWLSAWLSAFLIAYLWMWMYTCVLFFV